MAPAAVSLAARPLADGRVELELVATARGDLDDLILELHLPAGVRYAGGELVRPVGRMATGDTARLVAWTQPGAGVVIGGARLRGGGVRGAVTTSVSLGERAARPAARERVLATPFGAVTEVRQ